MTEEPLSDDNLGARLDALLRSHDTTAMGEILEYQDAHLEYIHAKYPGVVDLFELCFSLLAEISDGLNVADKSRRPSTRHRATQFRPLRLQPENLGNVVSP
jgi:hypothetical protein